MRRASAIAVTGSLALFVLTVLASCAPGLMSRPLVDGIPAGLLLALVQPLAVVLAVVLYEIAACRPQDPPAGTVAEQPAPEPWWAVVR
ncbi:DUF485 domain-containing protein [Streptomyces sp. NPDC093223]|uniref:DUF485 domain-containing protein n=1 Tax=Streptomyces sp. NPDC093223 TaxID=3366033 RepID=UPI0037FC5289